MPAEQLLSADPSAGVVDAQAAEPQSPPQAGISPRAARAIAKLDDVVLGVPIPSQAVTSAARTIGRSVMGRVPAMEGVKAAATTAAPIAKYELAKNALEAVGIPTPYAMAAATWVSGYKRGGKIPATSATAAEAEASVAARAGQAASRPAAPAPGAALSAPQSSPTQSAARGWSPQRIRNEVGLAERRGGLKLTEAQRSEADALVSKGLDPKAAVHQAAQAPAASAPTSTGAAQKPRLSAAEVSELQRMVRAGKTTDQAYQAIQLQRTLARKLGTPTPARVQRAVAERNATGRWSGSLSDLMK